MSATAALTNIPRADEADPFAPKNKRTLGQDEFMKLFITQLQYQDPLKPMDSYEMASQMAMFSNVEALNNMNTTMDSMLAYQTSQNNIQLLNLLGKEVQAYGNQVAVVEGAAQESEFTLDWGSEQTKVEIYDAGGKLVRSLDLGAKPEGTYGLSWDGKDGAGKQVADGAYSYRVKALDYNGEEVPVAIVTTGKVTGLEFLDGKATMTVDEYINIEVGEVIRVM